jgi:diguanylate cyclase (GGDEF)-like protein
VCPLRRARLITTAGRLLSDSPTHSGQVIETGDKLLQVVTSRLMQCVRGADVIVRMGGDEFVVVFLDLKSDEEVTLGAGRIIDMLNAPIVVDERSMQISASVGIG